MLQNIWIEIIFTILATSVLTSGILSIIVYLLREKVKFFLQYSTKFGYDKRLEEYKAEELKRQKAILIAELIEHPDDRRKLNKLSLEAFIWLPKETANKLSKILTHDPSAPNIKELVAEVRTIIQGIDQEISSSEIIIFPPIRKESSKAF